MFLGCNTSDSDSEHSPTFTCELILTRTLKSDVMSVLCILPGFSCLKRKSGMLRCRISTLKLGWNLIGSAGRRTSTLLAINGIPVPQPMFQIYLCGTSDVVGPPKKIRSLEYSIIYTQTIRRLFQESPFLPQCVVQTLNGDDFA